MQAAAVELYLERGPSGVTAAEIAERAGVTERTFFRHFSDKAEAFFGDEARLREHLADLIDQVPDGTPALQTALEAFSRYAEGFSGDADAIRRRAVVIEANPELHARELLAGDEWALLISNALAVRGIHRAEATEVARVALTIFRVAYEQWIGHDDDGDPLEAHLHAIADRIATQFALSSNTAGTKPAR